jgi:hypothetical protein
MDLDPTNPVIALCAEGMAVGGDAAAASEYFARAWAIRRDDFDAAVAAHYMARQQPAPAERLPWDARAVTHAEAALALGDARVPSLLASLYLNLGDALLTVGRAGDARDAAEQAEAALGALPDGGYREFVAGGVARLRSRAAIA